jgi:hypothetical protein
VAGDNITMREMIARAFALGSERKAKKTTKEKGKSNDRG